MLCSVVFQEPKLPTQTIKSQPFDTEGLYIQRDGAVVCLLASQKALQ